MTQAPDVQFRESTPEDLPFLRSLFVSARQRTFDAMPLPEAQKEALIDMQFRARNSQYSGMYPASKQFIASVGVAEIGCVWLDRHPQIWRILDISVLTSERNKGIGEAILRWVIAQAGASPVGLSVEPTNPARRLYERLGFCEQAGSDYFVEMVRYPS